jgi:hypothetical protein
MNVMKINNSKPIFKLASPSNLLIAGLVALLLAGYGTDWKILFGRSTKPKPRTRLGATELAVGAHRARHLRRGFVPGSDSNAAKSNSEVADSRAATHESEQTDRKMD